MSTWATVSQLVPIDNGYDIKNVGEIFKESLQSEKK